MPFDFSGVLADLADADFRCRELTDPTIDDRAVPADLPDLADPDGPTAADAAWWAESTRLRCPIGVPLPLYRLACECVGLGPVGFCEGFEPHTEDWPTDTDAIPAELMPA